MTEAFQRTVPVLVTCSKTRPVLTALPDGEWQEQSDEKVVHALVFTV